MSGEVSPDGKFVWDGKAWQPRVLPVQSESLPPPTVRPQSPDGQFEWDGTAWQPMAASARATQAAPPLGSQAPQPAPGPAGSPSVFTYGTGNPGFDQPAHASPPPVGGAPGTGAGWGASAPMAMQSARPQMGRWRAGIEITKASWMLLRSDPQLMVLPVLSALGLLVMVAVFGIPAAILSIHGASIVVYVLVFLLYVGASFVSYFFSAALVGAATLKMEGKTASARDGLALAWSRRLRILEWAVVSATVGMIIRTIERRLGILGFIIGTLGAVGWAIATTFMVPVLLYQDGSMWDSVKSSATIIRKQWGENLVVGATNGLITFLAFLALAIVSLALVLLSPIVAAVVFTLGMCALVVVASALSGIFRASLYRYAVSGAVAPGFSQEMFVQAFRKKRKWGLF